MSQKDQFHLNTKQKLQIKDVRIILIVSDSSETQAFSLCDSEGHEAIDPRELRVSMRALGIEPKADEMQHYLQMETLDFSDYLSILTKKMSEKDTRESIEEAFDMFATGTTPSTGDQKFITLADLRRMSTMLWSSGQESERLTDAELREMLFAADEDKDGRVSKEEFIRYMRKTGIF